MAFCPREFWRKAFVSATQNLESRHSDLRRRELDSLPSLQARRLNTLRLQSLGGDGHFTGLHSEQSNSPRNRDIIPIMFALLTKRCLCWLVSSPCLMTTDILYGDLFTERILYREAHTPFQRHILRMGTSLPHDLDSMATNCAT